MGEDDKVLVERLFAMADEYDSGHHESWPTIDALEIAAHRIETLSAENERLHGIIKTAWFFASRLTLIAVGLTIIWSVLP